MVALREAQILREGTGEAGDKPVVACELFVRVIHCVTSAEGDNAHDVRILHDLGVEVVDGRDGDLEHDLGALVELCKILLDDAEHDLLRLCLVGAVDVDLGFEDGADAVGVRLFDDEAHLCAEDVTLVRAIKQCVKPRDGLHELNAVLLVGKPLVDLEDGDDALLIPEEIGGKEAVDLTVHCVLKEDCREDSALVERGALDDAGAHLVNARKHLLFTVVGALVDAVCFQCLRRRAAALIECGDKALVVLHAGELLLVHNRFLLVCFAAQAETQRR